MAIGRRTILAGGAALWVAAPGILRAQSASKVTVSHGMAMHGDLKYPADAGPPDYVNPDAPKGGSVKFGTQGTFDSLPSLHHQGGGGGRPWAASGSLCAGTRPTRPSRSTA
jgi:ABC-type oligopeptide transport system substrate-binding subunit